MIHRIAWLLVAAGVAVAGIADAETAPPIPVGNLVDFTGPTASVGIPYGRGKEDAVAWINAHGGVAGRPIALDTFDAGYEVPPAIARYQAWHKDGAVAVQGWGTADAEALSRFVGEDQIPFFSASYSSALTDPLGRGPETKRPSPYNFIMGPSYSDGIRALLDWAKANWQGAGREGQPRFVHMGDNHPYPASAKKAGEAYARELGFIVLPAIQYPMAPTDVRQQCLDLKASGADYAYLGNTAGSNIGLLQTCRKMGVQVQFLSNIWGIDEPALQAAGPAADGVVWVMGGGTWLEGTQGMAKVREIAAAAGTTGYQPHHYIRAVCSVFFMREAMNWAAANGGVTGPHIRDGLYQKRDWVPEGLEGACSPATWTPDDHRGFNLIRIYQARIAEPLPADADLTSLIEDGKIAMAPVFEVSVPRRADWLGW
ncbi:MAG: ABC transporter substrate-binding protein [Rhodospirillales bacterium]